MKAGNAVQRYVLQMDPSSWDALQADLRQKDGPTLRGMAKALGLSSNEVLKALNGTQLRRSGAQAYGGSTQFTARFGGVGAKAALAQFQFSGRTKPKWRIAELAGNHAFATEYAGGTPGSILRADLDSVAALGGGSVLDKIQNHPKLSAEGKDRILAALGIVRATFMDKAKEIEPEPTESNYQITNWYHTRAEVDFVLASADANGLSGTEIEDAVLTSTFSDARKTPENFITHNIDGAKVAATVLPRLFDINDPKQMARIEGICAAIEEHQIGPPNFMGNIIVKGMLTGKLSAEFLADPAADEVNAAVGNPVLMTPERRAELMKSLPEDMSVEGRTLLSSTITKTYLRDSAAAKIAKPFDNMRTGLDGRGEIRFMRDELDMLSKIGVERWTVPSPKTAHYAASRSVIDGDSLVNYATPEGFAKIIAIRGPKTTPFFMDARIEDSIQSAFDSFDDAFTVMTPEGQGVAVEQRTRTEGALAQMKADLQSWLDSKPDLPRNDDGTIPFWDADLVYPKGNTDDLTDLSPLQQSQFELAETIRNKAVSLMRAAHEKGVQ